MPVVAHDPGTDERLADRAARGGSRCRGECLPQSRQVAANFADWSVGFRLAVLARISAGRAGCRTLAPPLRIQPGLKDYRLQLTDPLARVLLINCMSLLPGTLAARLEGDRVELHLLDASEDPEAGLHQLEAVIARLFGLSLEATDA